MVPTRVKNLTAALADMIKPEGNAAAKPEETLVFVGTKCCGRLSRSHGEPGTGMGAGLKLPQGLLHPMR